MVEHYMHLADTDVTQLHRSATARWIICEGQGVAGTPTGHKPTISWRVALSGPGSASSRPQPSRAGAGTSPSAERDSRPGLRGRRGWPRCPRPSGNRTAGDHRGRCRPGTPGRLRRAECESGSRSALQSASHPSMGTNGSPTSPPGLRPGRTAGRWRVVEGLSPLFSLAT